MFVLQHPNIALEYDPILDTWLIPETPSPRLSNGGLAVANGEMYFVGEHNNIANLKLMVTRYYVHVKD